MLEGKDAHCNKTAECVLTLNVQSVAGTAGTEGLVSVIAHRCHPQNIALKCQSLVYCAAFRIPTI